MSQEDHPTLEFKNVSRIYRGADHPAVKDVSLAVNAGEILALVGESGSGKTTLLRLAAGLETPDAGEILIDGKTVASKSDWVPTEKREVGFVFQDGALFPHLTVEKNVGYGLPRQSKDKRSAAVDYMLAMVGLTGFHSRFPHELSGGERQRLAVARALAPHPKILLLDEPFSNLDPALRRSLREEIQRILRKVNATAIMVTHDTEDALVVGDRIAIFREGEIEQIGSARELYHEPRNGYCARLFGPANEVKVNGSGTVSWVRPEDMSLVCKKPDCEAVSVRIRRIADAGRHREALVEAPAITKGAGPELWTVHVSDDENAQVGGQAWVLVGSGTN